MAKYRIRKQGKNNFQVEVLVNDGGDWEPIAGCQTQEDAEEYIDDLVKPKIVKEYTHGE